MPPGIGYGNKSQRKYKRKGVPTGYKHNWRYGPSLVKERKIGPGLWTFTRTGSKSKKSRSYGGFPKGTAPTWYLKGIQKAYKTAKGKYKLKFKGIKKLIKIKVPKRRKKYHRNTYKY